MLSSLTPEDLFQRFCCRTWRIPIGFAITASVSMVPIPEEAALVRSITACREDYFLVMSVCGDIRHTR